MPVLNIGDLDLCYEEIGSVFSEAVLLLHGWPDDASTWAPIADALAASGKRVIVPTIRGFGQSRFVNAAAPRTANSGILAMDMIALLDGLAVGSFVVAGHDWGSNIAEALAVGWPERVDRLAMLASVPRLGGVATPPFKQSQRDWYHWFMATKRGAEAVRADRRGFAHLHWVNWSPPGWFDEATFAEVAGSWENPDWVDLTLHSYRVRWDEASPDSRSEWLEEKIRATKTLALPTLFIKGDEDGVTTQESFAEVPTKFSGPFEIVGLPGVGHFPTREAPAAVAELLISFFAAARP
jgi:pimeloyl-ACP methyl ester carboxylesterase